jgi:redox-sensitive bicupin YhaK (pirin superfamily)
MHPHRDMEILTYILSGALQHRDSMGNGSVIRAGDWQKMSAGTGVLHSEFNASTTEPTHLLQIWIVPDRKGLPPGYGEKRFPDAAPGAWRVVASKDGRDDSIVVHQDVVLSSARLRPGDRLAYELARGRGAWLHVAAGTVTVNGTRLEEGDALGVEDESRLEVVGEADGEVLLFDLG